VNTIVIEKLTKTIKPNWPWQSSTEVLRGVSFSVGQGEIFGFLGPNGAGKTTTLKILLGLIRQTSGYAEVLGMPVGTVEIHRRVGFLPESPYFYDYLTAEEFLRFYGRLAGLDDDRLSQQITFWLETLGLSEAKHRQLRKFSKGMLQRVGLAQAVIHDPELVIFDEPMSGLDPLGRKEVRDLMLHLRDQGKTVFFSTHIIPDVEMICDRAAVLIKGEIVASGRVDELVGHGKTRHVEVICEGIRPELLNSIRVLGAKVNDRGSRCLIVLPDPQRLDELLSKLRSMGSRLVSVTPHKGSLEEVFVQQVQAKEEYV
jgi:ABC-2 type transport system ATP-binding protein